MENFEFNGTLYEPVFATSRGTDYFFSKESGLWIRRKKTGKIEDDKCMYVGSVGHDAEIDVLQVFYDLNEGLVKDFIPGFVIGRDPFSVSLEGRIISPVNLVRLGNNEVRLSLELQKETGWHRGHTISKIYREFHPVEEYGLKYNQVRSN